jgi:hypothetical protein
MFLVSSFAFANLMDWRIQADFAVPSHFKWRAELNKRQIPEKNSTID